MRLVLCLITMLFGGHAAVAQDWVVTDAGDAGDGTCDASCTLRDAIAAAGADERVLFDLALPNPLLLDFVGPELVIDRPLRIVANDGVPTVLRRGSGNARFLRLATGADVRIVGLGFEGARYEVGTPGADALGGAVRVDDGATLELRQCLFRDNLAQGSGATASATGAAASGGAIWSQGDLLVEGCAFVDNVASAAGGDDASAPDTAGRGGEARGGAIFAMGAVDIINSTFSGNEARGGDGGQGFDTGDGGSGGDARGGALFLAPEATPTLAFSTLLDNRVFGGVAGAGGAGGGLPGTDGAVAGEAVAALVPMLIDTSVLVGRGVGVSTCEGTALSVRSANLIDGSGCPGTPVADLSARFLPIDPASAAPHYEPLLGSEVVDSTPDCLDAVALETVALDQLLGVRPAFGDGTRLGCDFGAVEATVVLFASGFEALVEP